MVKALLFDLDGTLLDTSLGIFKTADKTALTLGLKPCRDYKKYAEFVGPPLHIGFNRVYGLTGEDAYRAADIYKGFYPQIGIHEYSYYQGLLDAVAELKKRGYLLAVATLKNEKAARQMIASTSFSSLMDTVHGCDEKEIMGKADVIRECLKSLNIDNSEAIMIGDSLSDMNGAKDSGVGFLAVSWGFGFPTMPEGLEYVNKAEELLEKFKGVSYAEN